MYHHYGAKTRQPRLKEKYRMIYTPKGAAREYSELALNLATGCEHGCIYCYGPSIRRMSREGFRENVIRRKNLKRQLELDLQEMAAAGDTRRVLLCFMTDAYQPQLADETRTVLEMFKHYDIAFQVLTKNGKLAERDFDLYDTTKDAYASTIVFSNDRTRRHYEPNAGTIDERIHSLKVANAMGIETWVSLEPVIIPEEALRVIEMTKDYTDHYKVGKINHFYLENEPDWRDFTQKAIRALRRAGKDYYIKKSLQPYM